MASEGWRANCARQIAHIGDPFQKVNHAFAGGRGFGETASVLGKVLNGPISRFEVGEEDEQFTWSDRLREDKACAVPKDEGGGDGNEDIEGALEGRGQALAFDVLFEIAFALSGKGASKSLFQGQGLHGFDGRDGFREV